MKARRPKSSTKPRRRRWPAKSLSGANGFWKKLASQKNHLYEASGGNVLFLWDEYANCRQRGRPLPERVLEYFDSVERALVKIREDQPTGKELARAASIALRLTRRGRAPGNAVSEWLALRNEFQLALLVAKHLKDDKGNTNPTSACGFVAAAVGASASTVERYYRRHRAIIEELEPPDAPLNLH